MSTVPKAAGGTENVALKIEFARRTLKNVAFTVAPANPLGARVQFLDWSAGRCSCEIAVNVVGGTRAE